MLLKNEVASEIKGSNLLPVLYEIIPVEYAEKLQDDPSIKSADDVRERVS